MHCQGPHLLAPADDGSDDAPHTLPLESVVVLEILRGPLQKTLHPLLVAHRSTLHTLDVRLTCDLISAHCELAALFMRLADMPRLRTLKLMFGPWHWSNHHRQQQGRQRHGGCDAAAELHLPCLEHMEVTGCCFQGDGGVASRHHV